MKEEELFRYYSLFKNLRVVQDATRDIDNMNDALEYFERESAIEICSQITLKYEAPINRIGSLFTGLKVYRNMSLYTKKTDDDIYGDLEYVRNCVIVYATVKCGLEPDYLTCLKKIM